MGTWFITGNSSLSMFKSHKSIMVIRIKVKKNQKLRELHELQKERDQVLCNHDFMITYIIPHRDHFILD